MSSASIMSAAQQNTLETVWASSLADMPVDPLSDLPPQDDRLYEPTLSPERSPIPSGDTEAAADLTSDGEEGYRLSDENSGDLFGDIEFDSESSEPSGTNEMTTTPSTAVFANVDETESRGPEPHMKIRQSNDAHEEPAIPEYQEESPLGYFMVSGDLKEYDVQPMLNAEDNCIPHALQIPGVDYIPRENTATAYMERSSEVFSPFETLSVLASVQAPPTPPTSRQTNLIDEEQQRITAQPIQAAQALKSAAPLASEGSGSGRGSHELVPAKQTPRPPATGKRQKTGHQATGVRKPTINRPRGGKLRRDHFFPDKEDQDYQQRQPMLTNSHPHPRMQPQLLNGPVPISQSRYPPPTSYPGQMLATLGHVPPVAGFPPQVTPQAGHPWQLQPQQLQQSRPQQTEQLYELRHQVHYQSLESQAQWQQQIARQFQAPVPQPLNRPQGQPNSVPFGMPDWQQQQRVFDHPGLQTSPSPTFPQRPMATAQMERMQRHQHQHQPGAHGHPGLPYGPYAPRRAPQMEFQQHNAIQEQPGHDLAPRDLHGVWCSPQGEPAVYWHPNMQQY
ncbi:hypothetical protein GGR57DRAFT_483972 [Xylariaceae sp. FL1272]|nr:hypothetical protein GGR57DRAFT_483972 [Xylariaceae sp. FL1272]